MRIKYSPLIDKEVTLQTIAPADLEGKVTLQGTIAGRPAQLILSTKEAATIFRALRKMDIEALERVYGDA